MKRIGTLLAGTALAAALSFGGQATNPPAKPADKAVTTPAPQAKKHVKKHKKANAAPTATAAPATSAAPAAPAAKK